MATKQSARDIREQLHDAISALEHILPAQAPIRDFVHHNTLHGMQHLPFCEALAESSRLTGARGYLEEDQYRDCLKRGRISPEDLLQVIDRDPELDAASLIGGDDGNVLVRRDVYLAAMSWPIKSLTSSQLNWQLEEQEARHRLQSDVPEPVRKRLLSAAGAAGFTDEASAVADLWAACVDELGLTHYLLHPEDLVDLSPEHAEQMLLELSEGGEEGGAQPLMERLIRKESGHLLVQLLERVGVDLTLEGLLRAITGHDVLYELRPTLLRQVAGYLDQGLAAWHSDSRDQGFYAAWRRSAAQDLNWILEEIPDWYTHFESLPEDPMETIVTELRRLGLRQHKWAGYLKCLALELPGWSGMFLWRHLHPGYQGVTPKRVEMVDYLAVRMVLEHLFAQRLCNEFWQIEASLDLIRWHFRHHTAEFLVRHALYSGRLPEYLASLAQRLTEHSARGGAGEESWWHLAHMMSTWRQSPSADRTLGHSVYRSAWRLFRLAQHLGLCGSDVRALGRQPLEHMLDCLDRLTPGKRGHLWLQSYEINYRDSLLSALVANLGRVPDRVENPAAQVVFCMDDREEGIRRHLEEVDERVETFGAAAHFNVPNIWRALGREAVGLAPVVIDPAHEIRETPRSGFEERAAKRHKRERRLFRLEDLLYQESRRNLLVSALLIGASAPAALLVSLGKLFAHLEFGELLDKLRSRLDVDVSTEVQVTAVDRGEAPTPAKPRLGFTDDEQLDRLETLLRNIGLIKGFSRLVVIMAHGSSSHNNPHLAAYDCGACSGRHSGPNARILAAIANRPEIRRRLASERRIEIPEQTRFLGAERNTCNEAVEWYDLEDLPSAWRGDLERLRSAMDIASQRHAHERCRRLASAPSPLTPEQALAHVRGRALDFSQGRPELGHATNAAAFIGRRCSTRGLFLDRRVFLISYDHTTDEDGSALERLLLANAPVGAGISLEYYFSTVDNERYGCGSKVTHNLTGMFGVMEGASSDLRTGLPRQMIEIHEAMRLQVVIEAPLSLVAKIYGRHEPLQELIGGGWILISVMDPGSGEIALFEPGEGFVRWRASANATTTKECSESCYRGQTGPVAPCRVSLGRERDNG